MTATLCDFCGQPMPEGEQMFKFHGYSGPCPSPPLRLPVPAPAFLYRLLIDPMRATARENGYALTVHGSLNRDIDLVAVPWIEDCVAPDRLVWRLVDTIKAHNGGYAEVRDTQTLPDGSTRENPHSGAHGRFGWSIRIIDGDGPYVDLSVISPRCIPTADFDDEFSPVPAYPEKNR